MGFIVFVNYLESITSWVCILVSNDFVTLDVDVAFDFRFLGCEI